MKVLLLLAALCSAPVLALEQPVGAPQKVERMEIAAVYLQPVDMAPAGHMRPAADSDIHLEADIRALAGHANGFPEGSWIPHLRIRYALVKQGAAQAIEGRFMAMVASDGPHYGDNVKLQGPGRYTLRLSIEPPADFGRHTDRATGVQPWFKPFTVEWSFVYAGTGKKGGY